MRYLFFVALFWFFSLSALAQTITVRNFLNPDAPVARDSLALIEFVSPGAETFTDQQMNDPVTAPKTLGGVMVLIDGVLQRIRSVSPTGVVILVNGAGRASRALELRTKFNVIHRTSITVASVWPSLFVQDSSIESESFYPAGLYTTDGINLLPITSASIPVGPTGRPTLVIIQVSGLRRGLGTRGLSVRLNGIQCTVVGVRSSFFAGQDELTFQIPSFLAGNGVMDLIITVDGRSSNLARLNLGGAAGLIGN
ncbi:MAG: hypothetical protein M3X11_06210 [Acidobacteriota bacterium]|nr:hypothetical protein [Acidobacteriota bacterium]